MFLVKAKYNVQEEDGTLKKIVAPYLVDAESFSEAEARIYESVGELVVGGLQITTIAIEQVNEIIDGSDNDDHFYFKVKIAFDSENSDTGKKQQINEVFYVREEDTKKVVNVVEEVLKEGVMPFNIKSVSETKIQEVFLRPPLK